MWLVIIALIIFIVVIFFAPSSKSISSNSTYTNYTPTRKSTRIDEEDDLEDVRTMYMADHFDDKFR